MFTYLLTDLPVVSTISVDVKHHVYLLTYWSPRSQYDLCGRKAPCLLTYWSPRSQYGLCGRKATLD